MEEEDKVAPEDQQLTKKEFKVLKRQQKERERLRHFHQKKTKKFLLITGGILIIGVILGFIWFSAPKSVTQESEIISNKGIHWHAVLTIKILGEFQDIPANIGVGVTHQPLHTHEPDGVIHMEFPNLVTENDIRIGNFFEIWSKKFNKNCIFDRCSGPEGKLKMFVNEKLNFEFENYTMRDGDKIEIIFE